MKKQIDYYNILQNLWYNIENEGYSSLKKEHIPIILEYGTPKEVAALIVNGYEEPVKHSSTPVLTEKKAHKIADTYSHYQEYRNSLIIGDALAKIEIQLNSARDSYELYSRRALGILKDYMERANTAELLSKLIENATDSEKRKIKPLIDEYNQNIECSYNITSKRAGDYKLKMYNGKVIVCNVAKLQDEFKRECSFLCTRASIYKTYLLTIKKWVADLDAAIITPTDILLKISNPYVTMEWTNVPYQYTKKYASDKNFNKETLSLEEERMASFPNYESVSVYNDLEQDIYNDLTTHIKDYRI